MSPIMLALKKLLESRFKLTGTLWFIKTNVLDLLTPEVLLEIEAKVDVVINGQCWGAETVAGARGAVVIEKRGKPTITLGYGSTRPFFTANAAAEGMSDLPFLGALQPLAGNAPEDVEVFVRANMHAVAQIC